MTAVPCDVFISYRRDGGGELAHLIYKDLKSRGYRVFMDVRELGSGHFDDELRRILEVAKDLVLILTPGALDRCSNEGDWVREEITLALHRGLNIVPVKTQGFHVPAAEGLPTEIRDLPRHNIVDYTHDKSDESLRRLRWMLRTHPSLWRRSDVRIGAAVTGVLLLLLTTWLGFHLLRGDTQALRQDTVAVCETVGDIKTDTVEIKEGTTKVATAVERLDQKFDSLQLQIRETIGVKKLGPEYENTAFHRDYQDAYLKKGGNLDVLTLEYRGYVASAPNNAMYHYLLARLYDTAEKYDEARAEAQAGFRVDQEYFWNSRMLLYMLPPKTFDLKAYLAREASYYRITAEEQAMFSSNEPAKIAQAFRQVKDRFRDDLTIATDLKDRQLCWHLFAALSKLAYANGSAFQNLVGREAVSTRNTLKMKVLEVRTGESAISVITDVDPVAVNDEDQEQHEAGRPGWMRAINKRKEVPFRKRDVFMTSIKMPPVAVRLSIEAGNIGTDTTQIKDRDFVMGAHASRPAEELVKEIFGSMEAVDPEKQMLISNDRMDVKDFSNPRDFWVYFFGMPVSWHADKEVELDMQYLVENRSPRLLVGDSLTINSNPAKNLRKATVDASLMLELYAKLAKMTRSDLKGYKITMPMEARISRRLGNTATVCLLGFSDMKCSLVFDRGVMADEAIKAAADLGLKWPPRTVVETTAGAAVGSWIRFTGTSVHKDAGNVFIIPDSVTVQYDDGHWSGDQ